MWPFNPLGLGAPASTSAAFDGSSVTSLGAATVATGGLMPVSQSGTAKKMTVTAAGATIMEAANAAAQRTAMAALQDSATSLTLAAAGKLAGVNADGTTFGKARLDDLGVALKTLAAIKGTATDQPTTGQTVTIAAGITEECILPGSLLATLTINLPFVAGVPDRTRILVYFVTNGVTALTVGAADPSGISVFNPPTSAAADTAFEYMYRADLSAYCRIR